MARFAWKSSSTLLHRLSVINLAIQRFNSKKEQEETRRLRITHRVSLVSKTTRGEPLILLLAISSFGFVGLALLGVELNQIPRLNQRLNHRSSGARLNISRWQRGVSQRGVRREEQPRQCRWQSQEDSTEVGGLALSSALPTTFLPRLTTRRHMTSGKLVRKTCIALSYFDDKSDQFSEPAAPTVDVPAEKRHNCVAQIALCGIQQLYSE